VVIISGMQEFAVSLRFTASESKSWLILLELEGTSKFQIARTSTAFQCLEGGTANLAKTVKWLLPGRNAVSGWIVTALPFRPNFLEISGIS